MYIKCVIRKVLLADDCRSQSCLSIIDNEALVDHEDDEHDEHEAHGSHKYHNKREIQESFDFNDVESIIYNVTEVFHSLYRHRCQSDI